MKKLNFRLIYLLNALWLIGLIHILYYGLRPYRHYRYEDRVQPDTQAVILTLGLFSLFFIVGNIIQLIPIWKNFAISAISSSAPFLFFRPWLHLWVLCMPHLTGLLLSSIAYFYYSSIFWLFPFGLFIIHTKTPLKSSGV